MAKPDIYILHHANCFDGTGAKYAAWCYFKEDATYIPVQYGEPFPSEVKLTQNSEVYIVDFSYPREILEEVHSKVGLLQVLDHHKTAQEALAGLDYAEFDMNRSGAVMAWQFFHPGKDVPQLLLHVQDGDLWKFKMADTEAVRAALPLLEGRMSEWSWVCGHRRSLNELIERGNTILSANRIKIDSVVKNNVKVLPYRGLKAGVYNTTQLTSEIGNAVYDEASLGVDISLSYFIDREGTPIVSFRSRAGTGPDVSALAKELGGGGHQGAAGAKVDWQFLQNLYAGKL
jgi:oligoribonuclease NrnB/cAMP/cGMP phosphodiesterase (DHH superfamily)